MYQQIMTNEDTRIELEKSLKIIGEKIINIYSVGQLDAKIKKDGSIVTIADTIAENLIREWISSHFPNDSIRGEEENIKYGNERVWYIDPIDGTQNYSQYGNKFGISVGLIENNTPKMGMIFFPAENICISATVGFGAYINERPLFFKQSTVFHLNDSHFIIQPVEKSETVIYKETTIQQEKLLKIVQSITLDGSYTFSFLKFLEQDFDAILFNEAMAYDISGAVCISKELGLIISGYNGEVLDFNNEVVPIIISKNKDIHRAILDVLDTQRDL